MKKDRIRKENNKAAGKTYCFIIFEFLFMIKQQLNNFLFAKLF